MKRPFTGKLEIPKLKFLLRDTLENYVNELKKAQAFYMSNRDLVNSRKATDENEIGNSRTKQARWYECKKWFGYS